MPASIRDRAVGLIGGKVALAAIAALSAAAVVNLWPESAFGIPTVVLQWERDGTNIIHIRDVCTHVRCDADSAGDTWPLSKSSNVYYSVLAKRALSHATGQRNDRMHVLMGLGQGIGATAALELGHEWPIGMPTVDQRHDEGGYDYYTFDRYHHFYGQLHWTEASLTLLQKNLRY
jgi:hypothetical protein